MPIIDSTRNIITVVASKLFGQYGFHKTSMDEIAKTARKAKGSLYYHFKSKEELFLEVVSIEIKSLKKELTLIVDNNNLQADEKLRKYLIKRMVILNLATNYHETLKADFFEYFNFADDLRKELEKWEKSQINIIIEQGVKEGIFEEKKDKSVEEALLDVFIMLLKGLELPFYLQNKYSIYSLYFNDLVEILIKGMRK